MRLSINEHFAAVLRHKTEAQTVIDKAMNLHKTEILRIDELYSRMDVLAFGIVGAILALNDAANLSNPYVLIGILILICNAFWDFIARLDQYELNKTSAADRANYIHSELKKFLASYAIHAANETQENEQALDEAGSNFIEKMNLNSMTVAPQTKLTKWLGKTGYFILFTLALILIGIGLISPGFGENNDHHSKKQMRLFHEHEYRLR